MQNLNYNSKRDRKRLRKKTIEVKKEGDKKE